MGMPYAMAMGLTGGRRRRSSAAARTDQALAHAVRALASPVAESRLLCSHGILVSSTVLACYCSRPI